MLDWKIAYQIPRLGERIDFRPVLSFFKPFYLFPHFRLHEPLNCFKKLLFINNAS